MVPLHCTWLCITLQWLYFILTKSTLLYHDCTSLYFLLLYPTLVFHACNFTLLYPTLLFHGSTLTNNGCTSLYITLLWLSFTPLHSTLVCHGSPSLYLTPVADLGGVRGCKCTPLWRLVMYFCVRNYTSPSNDYTAVVCSNNNQAQLHTLTYQFPRTRDASRYSVRTASVTGSGRGNPKIFGRASRASDWTPLSKFLNPPLDPTSLYHCST